MTRAAAAIQFKSAGRFRRLLLDWYDRSQRKLPWRGESDPYRILVSEIMLQQTRVAVVENRYKKFIAQFPTPERLARAKEQTVLAAWSGLGYYRRARNLHAAAKEIIRRADFPRTAENLRELPGIGRYTANAVASIAFGEPVAVVDGNVKRVLQRVFAAPVSSTAEKTEERYWELAALLLEKSRPGDFNQAMMELGATVCLPAQPLCESCPVTRLCTTRGPLAGNAVQKRRKAILHYGLIQENGRVWLRQRPEDSSLMPGMWELPLLESGNGAKPLLKLRHSITTTDYTVLVHRRDQVMETDGKWVVAAVAHRLALTGLARKILRLLEHA
jgi:A/G-specific adenine glycosylase